MSSTATAPTPARGFSRLDMVHALVALVILLLLSGVPNAGSTDAEALLKARRHVAQALGVTRQLARDTGRPHGLAFDVGRDRVAVIDALGQVVMNSARAQPLLDELGLDLMSADFGEGHAVLVVGADGWPLAGGALRLRSGLVELELRVDAVTGFLEAAD